MEFMKLITGTAKTLLSNKTVHQILKYIAATTLTYASNKYSVSQYKYDANDTRNMIYQHNMNNSKIIDPIMSEQAMNLYRIDRFMKDLSMKQSEAGEDVSGLNIDTFLNVLANMTGDSKNIAMLKDEYYNNPRLLSFDHDTLETSAIADTYEINSGGLYVPIKNAPIITTEGVNVAELKNEYLEKRIELGDKPSDEQVYKLLQEYHRKNKTKDIHDYYNTFM